VQGGRGGERVCCEREAMREGDSEREKAIETKEKGVERQKEGANIESLSTKRQRE